ncbi:MAG: hypothetical protein ACLUD2_03150 [Clostridium sp.]
MTIFTSFESFITEEGFSIEELEQLAESLRNRMKRWNIKITKRGEQDFQQLDNSLKKQVAAGIISSLGPASSPHGYGKPLGTKTGKI